jgi:hypothetical protein
MDRINYNSHLSLVNPPDLENQSTSADFSNTEAAENSRNYFQTLRTRALDIFRRLFVTQPITINNPSLQSQQERSSRITIEENLSQPDDHLQTHLRTDINLDHAARFFSNLPRFSEILSERRRRLGSFELPSSIDSTEILPTDFIFSFKEGVQRSLNAQFFFSELLKKKRLNGTCIASEFYITANTDSDRRNIELNSEIFSWVQVDDIKMLIIDASKKPDELHFFGLEVLFNAGPITLNGSIVEPNSVMKWSYNSSEQSILTQQTNPELFELVNAVLANGGYNGLKDVLTEELFETIKNGFLSPRNADEERLLSECFEKNWQKIEQPCLLNYPKGVHGEAIYWMLGSTIALGRFAKFESTNPEISGKIQYFAALGYFRSQFNALLKFRGDNPEKTIIYHAPALGMTYFGNNPSYVGVAFSDAAKSFQQDLEALNRSRLSSNLLPIKVRVQFEITNEDGLECAKIAELQPKELLPIENFLSIARLEEDVFQLKELETEFTPACFSLLINFFKGCLGKDYCIQSNDFQMPPKVLYLGEWKNDPNALLLWMQLKTKKNHLASGFAIKSYEYFMHFKRSFLSKKGDSEEILSLQVNEKGDVLSIRLNNKPVPFDFFIQKDSNWTEQFLLARNYFLENYAFHRKVDYIEIHSLVISLLPELVLKQLNNINPKIALPYVSFLKDDLTSQPSNDAGGVRTQFLTSLFLNLLDGSTSRTLEIEEHSKTLRVSNPPSLEEIDLLFCFSNILSLCFYRDECIIGRLFPDSYFDLIKECIGIKKNLAEEILLTLAKIIAPIEQHPLWDIFSEEIINLPLPEGVHRAIENLKLFDLLDPIPDLIAIKKQVRDFLINTYQGCVISAQIIAYKLPKSMKTDFKSLSTLELSQKIQGLPFNREEIANRICYFGTDPVLTEKTTWLKEFILEKPKEWVLRFLFTITSQETITSFTRIFINSTTGITCCAHTCSKNLDIPNTHTDHGTAFGLTVDNKTKFFNNLLLTMSQCEFDMI